MLQEYPVYQISVDGSENCSLVEPNENYFQSWGGGARSHVPAYLRLQTLLQKFY